MAIFVNIGIDECYGCYSWWCPCELWLFWRDCFAGIAIGLLAGGIVGLIWAAGSNYINWGLWF